MSIALYVKLVKALKLISNDALNVLESAMMEAVKGRTHREALLILKLVCEEVEQEWCKRSLKPSVGLAIGLIRVVVKSRRPDLLNAFEDWILKLQERDQKHASILTIQWASALIAFDHREDGYRQIQKIQRTGLSRGVRTAIARVLLDAQKNEEAAALMQYDMVDEVDLADAEATESALLVAKLMLRAGVDKAKQLFISIAQQYREKATDPDGSIEASLLNSFYNLASSKLPRELLALAENELLHEARDDSHRAAQWYLALALSSIGNVETANKLREKIKDWKVERQMSAIRSSLVKIALAAFSQETDRELLLNDLAKQFQQIDDSKDYLDGLEMAARLVGPATTYFATEIARFIIRTARERDLFHAVIDTVCERLSTLNDELVVCCIVEDLFKLLDLKNNPPREVLGYEQTILTRIFGVIKKRIRSTALPSFLELTLRSASQITSDSFKVEVAIETIQCAAAGKIASPGFEELVHEAIRLTDHIKDERARLRVFVELTRTVAEWRPDSSATFAISANLLQAKCSEQDAVTVALAELYAVFVKHGIHSVDSIAQSIQSWRPPGYLLDRVHWITAVIQTPLVAMARPVAEDMLRDLDGFTGSVQELLALEEFLRGIVHSSRAEDGRARLLVVSEWAATMPKVINEDWRGHAFHQILSAASLLALPHRIEVQMIVLRQALAILPDSGQQLLWNHLRSFVRDSEFAEWAVNLYLTSELDSNSALLKPDRLLKLIVENFANGSDEQDNEILDAVCNQIEQLPVTFVTKRSELARVVCKVKHARLRALLGNLLVNSYVTAGFTDLETSDLNFLAEMPSEWWIEHSTEIKVSHPNGRTLTDWIESCADRSPEAAVSSVVLATDWISRAEPEDLTGFWFNVTTSAVRIPLDMRLMLLTAIEENNYFEASKAGQYENI